MKVDKIREISVKIYIFLDFFYGQKNFATIRVSLREERRFVTKLLKTKQKILKKKGMKNDEKV